MSKINIEYICVNVKYLEFECGNNLELCFEKY